MSKQNTDSGEASFTISGKIKITILLAALGTLVGLGTMYAKVEMMQTRLVQLEQKSDKNIEDHSAILSSLVRIEENSKFLKEYIQDMKKERYVK